MPYLSLHSHCRGVFSHFSALSSDISWRNRNKQKRQKMLWVDKYRPKTLDQVMVHTDIARNLKKLVCYSLYQINHFYPLFSIFLLWFFVWVIAGNGTGLPPFTLLWPIWLRQENPNHGSSPPNVRTWCRKGSLSLSLSFIYIFIYFCFKSFRVSLQKQRKEKCVLEYNVVYFLLADLILISF